MNKKRDETFNNEKERVKQYGKRKNYQKRNSHCLEHDAGGNRITNRIWSAKVQAAGEMLYVGNIRVTEANASDVL